MPGSQQGSSPRCIPELDYLKGRGLSQDIVYSRRCVKPSIAPKTDRNEITNITGPLFSDKTTVDLSSCDSIASIPCSPLTLHVTPPYPKRTYPELLFGVATTAERAKDSVLFFSHWLANSTAGLVCIVTDATSSNVDLPSLKNLFAQHGMDAVFVPPENKKLTTAQNHFAIIRNMLAISSASTKWLAILDDDTFFPSLYPLSQELEKHDYKAEQYIGALSEDLRAIKNWGYMAFGGAGVFLSVPIARVLNDHLEKCISEGPSEGDGILRECVYRHTRAKLTHIKDLHQQDLRGDESGFFEAGLQPLSLHHWKSWYNAPVDKMSRVASVCGDCFLQRWRFGTDTVLSNGYSVAVYRDGHEKVDLMRMEGTWGDTEGAFDHSIGPFRRKMEKGEKKSFKLLDAERVHGGFRQVYVWKDKERSRRDEVIELFWETG
jgi:hypothetical protein